MSDPEHGPAAAVDGPRVGVPAEVEFAEPRAGEVERSWADITKARQTLGYEPRVMLDDGLARPVEAMLATG